MIMSDVDYIALSVGSICCLAKYQFRYVLIETVCLLCAQRQSGRPAVLYIKQNEVSKRDEVRCRKGKKRVLTCMSCTLLWSAPFCCCLFFPI